MPKRITFIIIFTLWVAQFVAAQTGTVIYEGTQLDYSVDLHGDNSYAWNVTTGTNGVEYDMSATDNQTSVMWNLAGTYFLQVTESFASGCSTTRQLEVTVEPNNRSFEFNILASTECFNKNDNGFTLPFSIIDNNGNALAEAYFPMTVEYTVNGTEQTATVAYNNQQLSIGESIMSLSPLQNNEVIVAVTSVTDAQNAPVTELANALHTRTIFAIPTIEFTEELRIKYNLDNNEEIIAYYNGDIGRDDLRTKPE